MVTSNYNFLLQLNTTLINDVIKSMFKYDILTSEFKGEYKQELTIPDLVLHLDYDISIDVLEVSIGQPDSLQISAGSTARLGLYFVIDDDSGEPQYLFKSTSNLSFTSEIGLENKLIDGASVLYLAFNKLTTLNIEIDDNTIPAKYLELIKRVVERILVVKMQSNYELVPISAGYKSSVIGGWPISNAAVRVIGNSSSGNISVGFNTLPNYGTGRPKGIEHIIGGNHFGVAVDQNLLTQSLDKLWRTGQLPSRFNTSGKVDPEGAIRITTFNISILNNDVQLSLRLILEAPTGNIELWLHSTVSFQYQNGKFDVDIKSLSIEDSWASVLAIFFIFKLTGLLVFIAMKELVGKLTISTAEYLLYSMLNNSSIDLLYQGEIPGTNLELTIQAAEITITNNCLLLVGNQHISQVNT